MELLFKNIAYFNSILAFFVGLFILSNGIKNKRHILYFLFSISISLYAVVFANSIFSTHSVASLFQVKLFHAILCFLVVFMYLFIHDLVFENVFKKTWHFLLLITAFFSSYACLYLTVIKAVKTVGILPNWTVPGEQFYIYLTHYSLYTTASLIILIYGLRKKTNDQQQQIRFTLWGLFISLAGAWTTFLPGWGIDIVPYGIHFIFIFQLMVAYAIIKYQMFNIKATITRFGSICLASLLFFLVILLSVYLYYALHTQAPFDLNVMAFILILGIFCGASFQKTVLFLQTSVEKRFIQGWYDTGQIMATLSRSFEKALTMETLFLSLQDNLKDIEIPVINTLLLTHDTHAYTLTMQKDKTLIKPDNPLIQHFNHTRNIIRGTLLDKKTKATTDSQPGLKGELYVPFYTQDILAGVLIIGKKLSEKTYDAKDINLMAMLASQLSIAIDRITPYEKIKAHYENALKKDTVLNTIASINNEINAPLHAVYCATFLLKKELIHSDNEEIRKSLSGIEDDLGKIRLIVKRLMSLIRTEKKLYVENESFFDLDKDTDS